MRILLVWVSNDKEHEWVDSCWTEDKKEAAIERATRFRDNGFNSAIIAYTANHCSNMCDEWDEEFQEAILEWNRHGD
jgi:hypothetical protein